MRRADGKWLDHSWVGATAAPAAGLRLGADLLVEPAYRRRFFRPAYGQPCRACRRSCDRLRPVGKPLIAVFWCTGSWVKTGSGIKALNVTSDKRHYCCNGEVASASKRVRRLQAGTLAGASGQKLLRLPRGSHEPRDDRCVPSLRGTALVPHASAIVSRGNGRSAWLTTGSSRRPIEDRAKICAFTGRCAAHPGKALSRLRPGHRQGCNQQAGANGWSTKLQTDLQNDLQNWRKIANAFNMPPGAVELPGHWTPGLFCPPTSSERVGCATKPWWPRGACRATTMHAGNAH